MVDARVEQHVSVPPSLLSSKLHSFQVVVVNFPHVVTAETLSFELFIFVHFAFGNFTVVVLVPLLSATFISEKEKKSANVKELPLVSYILVKDVTVVVTA